MAQGFGKQQRTYGSINPPPSVGVDGTDFDKISFSNFCDSITTTVYTINASWRKLEQALKAIGTERDNQGLRDGVHVNQMSTNQIITQTQKDVQKCPALLRGLNLPQKLHIEKLTQDYKEAVQLYCNMQQQVAHKMKIHMLPDASLTQNDKQNGNVESQYETEDEKILQSQAQAERIHREIEFETGLLLEREQRVRQIEADTLDINDIMRELSVLVFDQRESINSIENNTEVVHSRIEEGRQELLKAAEYQAGYQRKTCLLLGIASIIVIIVVTILAVKLG